MAETNVKVVVRVRPFNKREIDLSCQNVILMNGAKTTISNPLSEEERKGKQKDHHFTFDKSYWSFNKDDPHFISNEVIFQDIGKEIIENAWDGFNCSVFAYGQTGSGKSYSMMGLPGDEGLIPRICESIFQRMTDSTTEEASFRVQVSYMEIYNEKIRDLLDPRKKDPLKIRTHPVNGPYVESLTKFAVKSYDNIVRLMELGNKSRTVASTNMNDVSSRSHAIFTIIFAQTIKDPESGITQSKSSNINLVDLAGSERVEKTGAEGDRLKEGASINVSLSALGRVISALAENKKTSHIPYRDSVLTWLLCQALGGNAKTFMIAAISPAADNFDETLSTLRYADRAKLIVNRAVVNEDPQAKLVRELREEIERLRMLFRNHGLNPELAGTPSMSTLNSDEELRNREFQIQQEAEKKVNELALQLSQTEQMMEDMNEAWEEKVRQSESLLQERTQQLQGTGISFQRSPSSVKLDHLLPSLVNLNEDSLMTECLLYYINPGTNSIGQSESGNNQIILSGLGVKEHHCDLISNDNTVIIRPIGDAAVYVNGKLVKEDLELHHADRVILGNNHIFRFSNPQSEDTGKRKGASIDWSFAQREFAQVQGNLNSMILETEKTTKTQPNLLSELFKAFQLTNEANAISQALSRSLVFNLELAAQFPKEASEMDEKPVAQKEIVVRVTSLDTYESCLWRMDKFSGRLFAMRELWVQSMNLSEEERKALEEPENDPFTFDFEELITPFGISHLSLTFLKYRAQADRILPVFDSKGDLVGKLHVEVFPSDSFGNPLEDRKTGVVLQPNSLLEKKVPYCVRVKKIADVQGKKKLFCRFSTWHEGSVFETNHIEEEGTWNLNFEQVVECHYTEEFLTMCARGVVAFEVFEERVSDASSRSQTRVPTGNFDFAVHVDLCELDYDGNWCPVPVKFELEGNDTYNKVYRLRHGQQRKIIIAVSPLHSVSFKGLAEGEGLSMTPDSCNSLKIGSLRLSERPQTEGSGEVAPNTRPENSEMTNFDFVTEQGSGGTLVISADWLATSHGSDLLRKKSTAGSRILASLEMDLEFNNKSFAIKFEKDLAIKIHSRDSEFSLSRKKAMQRELTTASKEAQDLLLKKFSWKYRVSVTGASPKKFVVGDKAKQAEVVLKALDHQLQSLDNVLALDKSEQDFDFFQSLTHLGKAEIAGSGASDVEAKIAQLKEKKAQMQQDPLTPFQVPLPVAVVNEIPKKRSNTLTNYTTPPTTTVTHEGLSEQIQELEDKMANLLLQAMKTKERLFLSTLLSIKMTLSPEGQPLSTTTPANEIFDELIQTEIPEEFWPQWIQHRLLDEHEGHQGTFRLRSETGSTASSTDSTETLASKIIHFFGSPFTK